MNGTHSFRLRRVAFTVCIALSTLYYAVLLSGLSALLSPAWNEPIHRVHHVGAALFIGIIVVGLLVQLHAPERNVTAFWQVVVGVLAIQITNFIMGNPDNHGGNVGLMDPAFLIFFVPLPILVLLHPARRSLVRSGMGISRVLASMSIVAAVPLMIYGAQQALVQRNSWPPLADPHHQKWFMMAFLTFAIPLVGLVASLRMEGWGVSAWSAGIAPLAFGLVAVLAPNGPSSAGQVWGSVSVLGGVAFIGAAVWEMGRDRVAPLLPQRRQQPQDAHRS